MTPPLLEKTPYDSLWLACSKVIVHSPDARAVEALNLPRYSGADWLKWQESIIDQFAQIFEAEADLEPFSRLFPRYTVRLAHPDLFPLGSIERTVFIAKCIRRTQPGLVTDISNGKQLWMVRQSLGCVQVSPRA